MIRISKEAVLNHEDFRSFESKSVHAEGPTNVIFQDLMKRAEDCVHIVATCVDSE